MDYISFCPSLFDIFTNISFTDVYNVQLVSRRFYQLINKYANRLPRPIAEIFITTNVKGRNVILLNYNKDHWFDYDDFAAHSPVCITSNNIRLYKVFATLVTIQRKSNIYITVSL